MAPYIREIEDLAPVYAKAACRGSDGDVFFPDEEDEEPETVLAKTELAKRFCGGCPVVEACRKHGVTYEEFGIWGGLTAKERRSLKRKRRNQ